MLKCLEIFCVFILLMLFFVLLYYNLENFICSFVFRLRTSVVVVYPLLLATVELPDSEFI